MLCLQETPLVLSYISEEHEIITKVFLKMHFLIQQQHPHRCSMVWDAEERL